MRQKLENARQQAREARERAKECSDKHVQEQWLLVARMWDELAREYALVQKLRD